MPLHFYLIRSGISFGPWLMILSLVKKQVQEILLVWFLEPTNDHQSVSLVKIPIGVWLLIDNINCIAIRLLTLSRV
jgi:hypothetical protein